MLINQTLEELRFATVGRADRVMQVREDLLKKRIFF